MQVSRFELWFKYVYPLPLSQKNDMGNKNHSTVNGFFQKKRNMVLRNFLDEKIFFLQVAIVLTSFQSEKSQNKLDWMQNVLLKRFTKLV